MHVSSKVNPSGQSQDLDAQRFFLLNVVHGGDISSLLYATPPPQVEVGRRPLGGGG